MTSTSKPMLTSINPDNNFIKEAHSSLWLKLAKKGMNYLFSLYFLHNDVVITCEFHFVFQNADLAYAY